MTQAEAIARVHAAQRELEPLLDFIHKGTIVPREGSLSYCYGTAVLRANDTREMLTKLLIAAMQFTREYAIVNKTETST